MRGVGRGMQPQKNEATHGVDFFLTPRTSLSSTKAAVDFILSRTWENLQVGMKEWRPDVQASMS